MGISFDDAIVVGRASDLFERTRKKNAETTIHIPRSGISRGLAIKSLQVTSRWDKLWRFLGKRKQIYFLTIAFDLSGKEPIILPPPVVSAEAVYKVKPGETISFTLGDGVPVFPLREIHGGLVIYISIVEADKGIRHIGEIMEQVHKDVAGDHSLGNILKKLTKSPTAMVADEILNTALAALQPIATILKNNEDDYIALFNGIYSAKGPWTGKLQQTQNDTTIVLQELQAG